MLLCKKTALRVSITAFAIVVACVTSLAFAKEAVAETTTTYTTVKISIPVENQGILAPTTFETADLKTVATIDGAIKASLPSQQKEALKNNHTKSYLLQVSNKTGGYSCKLYFDTLYDKAYIVRDSGIFDVNTDFARYIGSFIENTNISYAIDKADGALFQSYGWTLDYLISTTKMKGANLSTLSAFQPKSYYFAYNNELSKDIGLDMSKYTDTTDLDIKIYRIHESLPQEFYPLQDSRGIVVKSDGKVIGAFISAGRHSAFQACSLKGNGFGQVTGKTVDQWLAGKVTASSSEKKLALLTPEEVIQAYFTALNNKEAKLTTDCVSKSTLLKNLTVNMPNEVLFQETIYLPLAGAVQDTAIGFEALSTATLLKTEPLETIDTATRVFRVYVNLQYVPNKQDVTLDSGKQFWDCTMVYESAQTGWKIKSFGHG